MLKIKRALISVSDKTGLEDLAKALAKHGVEILSTGGTAKAIRALGIAVKDVSDYTGFPEMLDGRVKTLHPKIHGGLLALRAKAEHMKTAAEHGIGMIDMVVVNLYPFEKTVAKPGVTLEEAIEQIDIGGPSMLRSAAKNHRSVCCLSDPADYARVVEAMEKSGGSVPEDLLVELGVKVFAKTAAYDSAIHSFLSNDETVFPKSLRLSFSKLQDLRYGENPHQKAAFYKDADDEPGVATAAQLHGKELSYNNIIDLNAAFELVCEFAEPAAVIIKHTNPCGAATAKTLSAAYLAALDCDRLSAFGSIVGFNGPVDKDLAGTILKEADFVECVIAPAYDPAALEALKVKKNLRLLAVRGMKPGIAAGGYDMKKVSGGLLVQSRDTARISAKDLKVATKAKPSEEDIRSLLFAWTVCRHVKSNAIVICRGTATVGVGAGQMSRVDSVIIAARKSGDRAKGAVLASDAFFPKADGVEQAAAAGVRAIIQPGGSVRDAEVIAAADRLGIAMVLTGARHFKH